MKGDNQHTPKHVPCAPGQLRSDKHGGTIKVIGLTPGRRYIVEYPQLEGEVYVYGAETIERLYPNVYES